jgi:large subunit ribosomal protein L15
MRLHDLQAVPGSRKSRKRFGCGESSGHGKTSCRGHKGQKARSGAAIRPGFEGGQMPMHRRLPKKGFNNAAFQDKIVTVSLDKLEKTFDDGAMVTVAALREKRLVRGQFDAVKVLGNGELTKKLTVAVDTLSASAKEKIEKAGGSVVAAS